MFTEQERAIYKYHDGDKEVLADPLEIERRLKAMLGNDLNAHLKKVKDDYEAATQWYSAIDAAFEITPFSKETGKGATIAMKRRLWDDYWTWVKKKDGTTEETPS